MVVKIQFDLICSIVGDDLGSKSNRPQSF